MKKEVMVELIFCDVCGKVGCYDKCISCGKDFCFDCRKVEAKEYFHAVNFSGSGDGVYCLPCDQKKREDGDKLHAAYRVIQRLRDEANGFWADFGKRTKEAEAELKRVKG